MKYLAFFLLIILGLSSCTTYQYIALKSDLEKADNSGDFYYQDSLVRLDFNFWGQNFPVNVAVENIGDSDLYLDLARTLFLENDLIVSNAIQTEKGRISGNIDYMYDGLYSSGTLSAVSETSVPSDVIYIPSGKKIELNYSAFSFPFSKEIRKESQSSINSPNNPSHSLERYVYPENTAPNYGVRFYFIPNDPKAKGHITECTFSPNLVLTGSTPPAEFDYKGSDLFYTKYSQSDGVGGFLGIISVLTIIFVTLGLTASS